MTADGKDLLNVVIANCAFCDREIRANEVLPDVVISEKTLSEPWLCSSQCMLGFGLSGGKRKATR